jgi:hypothetical protein
MISRKISKSRNSRKSRKSSKLSSSKKYYTKIQKGGAYEYLYMDTSNGKSDWIRARNYQTEAIKEYLEKKLQLGDIYTYNKNGYKFDLKLLEDNIQKNEKIFEMTRENGTTGFLKQRYISAVADRIMNIE